MYNRKKGVGGNRVVKREKFIDSMKGIKDWHLAVLYVLIFATLVLVTIYK